MNVKKFIHTLQVSYIVIALLAFVYMMIQEVSVNATPVTEVSLAKDSPPTDTSPLTIEEETTEPESVTEAAVEEVSEEEITTEEPSTEAAEEPKYTFLASHSKGRLFIRNGPSLDHDIIGFMKPGSTGNVLELGEEWSLIQYQETQGYTFNGYLEFIPIEE